jgi:hypothetical protein
METRILRHIHGCGNMETWRHQTEKGKIKAQVIFLNTFTVCSSRKKKFVACVFVDKETNGSYPFANKQNGLNRLAHLWTPGTQNSTVSA